MIKGKIKGGGVFLSLIEANDRSTMCEVSQNVASTPTQAPVATLVEPRYPLTTQGSGGDPDPE